METTDTITLLISKGVAINWEALIDTLDKEEDLFYVKTIAITADLVMAIHYEEDIPPEYQEYLKDIMHKLQSHDAVNYEYQFEVYYLLSLYADADLA
mmetsp:Transcript_22073/g.10459  ORF Transcript_22073/g.10459 Transcript_22073/m.10459 type:complete len:97 (+) Transcript_22073:1080-1370(+)